MEMNLPVIKLETRNLTKKFSATEGVADISLQVYEHELLTLLGPSGCGKTTILRAIGGFNKIDSGKILLDGAEVQGLPPEKRPTGMVFQSYNLWPHMTIYENMAFGLKLRKTPKKEMDAQIAEMLALVKMSGSEKKYPTQLSGGQQQRVAIARALVLRPAVLLLDEPFSALDAKIRGQMREELKRIQREAGLTVIFVTHDQEEAMAISDRIAVMNQGAIEQLDSPTEIYDNPHSRFVAGFIGEMNFLDEGGAVLAVRPEDIALRSASGAGMARIESVMPLLYDLKGIILSNLWFCIPFAAMMMSAALSSVNDSYVESARDAGCSWRDVLCRIILPLTYKDVIVSATFILMGQVGAFTIPYLTGPNNPKMLGILLYQQTGTYMNYERAAALSVLMFLICLGGAIVYIRSNMKEEVWETGK